MIFKEGDYYIGDFREGRATGQGVYYGLDGTIYEGEMKDNFF